SCSAERSWPLAWTSFQRRRKLARSGAFICGCLSGLLPRSRWSDRTIRRLPREGPPPLQRLDLVKEQPALAREFQDLFGKESLAELRRQDRTRASQESEALFERAAKKYGDVKLPDGGTVGERARAELFEVRHLCVGKETPDIEGEAQ